VRVMLCAYMIGAPRGGVQQGGEASGPGLVAPAVVLVCLGAAGIHWLATQSRSVSP